MNQVDKFIENLKGKMTEACLSTAKEMLDDAKDRIVIPNEARNPAQFMAYKNSLKLSTVEVKGNEIKVSVYSDLVVSDGSKWDGVPIGAFLEWGTGPMGESSNGYPHGYPYTTKAPWDKHSSMQEIMTGTWGITARPHLYPALMAIKPKFKANVNRKVIEAWKQSAI